MSLFASLVLVGGTTGIAARRKLKLPLIDVLIDGEPKPATLLPPATHRAITRFREVAADLLSDTRQQYQPKLLR